MSNRKKDGTPKKKPGRKPGTSGIQIRTLPPGHIPERDMAVLHARFVEGKTLAEAGKAGGFNCTTENSFRCRATEVIKRHRDDPNSVLMQAIEKAGVNAAKFAEILAEGLAATVGVKVKEGDVSRVIAVPDFGTRHKYLETGLDITGGRAPKKIEVSSISFEERLLRITHNIEGQ